MQKHNIRRAIRLADLIPSVAEAFLQDQITIGHALLIAKLPTSQQQEAFAVAFRGMRTNRYFFQMCKSGMKKRYARMTPEQRKELAAKSSKAAGEGAQSEGEEEAQEKR